MQTPISELLDLGPLPPSTSSDLRKLETIQHLLEGITEPVTDDEARALSGLFGPDDCFGLAWTLVHAIETAPGWPLRDVLRHGSNEWIARLKQRSENASLATRS
jgi:hypothetical protein